MAAASVKQMVRAVIVPAGGQQQARPRRQANALVLLRQRAGLQARPIALQARAVGQWGRAFAEPMLREVLSRRVPDTTFLSRSRCSLPAMSPGVPRSVCVVAAEEADRQAAVYIQASVLAFQHQSLR